MIESITKMIHHDNHVGPRILLAVVNLTGPRRACAVGSVRPSFCMDFSGGADDGL